MIPLRGYIRQRPGRDALEAVIEVPGRGKVRKATGCRVGQEAEAERFLAEVIRELAEAAPPVPEGALTFQQWGEKWITGRKARSVVSAADEDAQLRFHAFPVLGAKPLRSITKQHMIEWARSLSMRMGQNGRTLSPRYVHHIAATVRRLMGEAVDMDLITVNPCAWKARRDLPAKADRDTSKRRTGGFHGWEVWALLFDPRIPEDRRTLYALEFLTGMRTGEAAVRRWKDLDRTAKPLQRLEVRTAWNTRAKLEKSTKTLVEKIVPVHPILAAILGAWEAEGWKRYTGRKPTPEDLVVPAERGGPRSASHSNHLFQEDLRTLQLRPAGEERRTHYETRSTFRSLALSGEARREDLDLITHPSPRQASDLYTRLDQVWPLLCRVVDAVRIAPGPEGEKCTNQCTIEAPEKKKARNREGLGPLKWRAVQESNRSTSLEKCGGSRPPTRTAAVE